MQDDATPKLREIQRVVGDFGGGSHAANMERFKRQTNEINESIRALTETLTKGPCCPGGLRARRQRPRSRRAAEQRRRHFQTERLGSS
jgi:hypothetical protein